MLANMLKGMLGKVLSHIQNAFVEGDSVLIASECIDCQLK